MKYNYTFSGVYKLWCSIMFFGVASIFLSCATSMSPLQVNNTLPSLTKSNYISYLKAEEAIGIGDCKYTKRARTYVAPMGLSTKDDLRNAARGIDEWVQLDGGNSYVLLNYKWVNVDDYGSTQLHVEFDTLLCE